MADIISHNRRVNIRLLKPRTRFNKKLLLVLPFVLMSLLLFIVPLIMVVVKSFLPTSSGGVGLNWSIMNGFIFGKIFLSIGLALAATAICTVIAYPFAYIMAFNRSKSFKAVVAILITAPIWSSLLVKLIGLKTFFDICAGYSNSTAGHIFTVIGLVYIYIPFMILPLYNVLDDMPRNLVFASQDLGQNMVKTFFKIVLPYSKTAFFAGLTLVFLPAVTTVAVPQFLNNASNNATIGDIIVQEGEEGLISDIALARSSSLSLVVSIFVLVLYLIIAFIPKLFNLRHRRVK
ncbi:MAG: ABC transporter permease [Mycoplasmoidaceae bacterium]